MPTVIEHPPRSEDLDFTELDFTTVQARAEATGLFSLQRRTFNWGSAAVTFTATLPWMENETARQWLAWLRRVVANDACFHFAPDVERQTQRHSPGQPVVDGAGQAGTVINFRGFTPDTYRALEAMSWVSLNDRLHCVLADVDSDGQGKAAVELSPAVRAPDLPDATPLVWDAPRGLFQLVPAAVDEAWRAGHALHGPLSFTGYEYVED